jgi:hypothetical protein
VVLDPKFVEQARAGKYTRAPEWLKTGIFEFQHDSIQYKLEAGTAITLPLPVAQRAIKRAAFRENPLTGDPIRPVYKTADLPGGVVSQTRCSVCGEDQDSIEELSKHLLSHVEFTESKEEATEIEYGKRGPERFPSAAPEPVDK